MPRPTRKKKKSDTSSTPNAIVESLSAVSSSSSSLEDFDIDQLLGETSDEEEDEDEDAKKKLPNKLSGRSLVAVMNKNTKKKKKDRHAQPAEVPWKEGDVVWKLQRWDKQGHGFPIKDEHLERTREQFEGRKEMIRGGLFVVKTPLLPPERKRGSKPSPRKALLVPVFDGSVSTRSMEEAVPEKVEVVYVHLYQRDFGVNKAIKDAMIRSIQWRMDRPDCHAFVSGLKAQHENVEDFMRFKYQLPDMESLKYLVMDRFDRDNYVRLWKPNWPYDVAERQEAVVVVDDDDGDDNPTEEISSKQSDAAKRPQHSSIGGDKKRKKEEETEEVRDVVMKTLYVIVDDVVQTSALPNGDPSASVAAAAEDDSFDYPDLPVLEQPSEKNHQLVLGFKSGHVQARLKDVMLGHRKSKRHDLLVKDRFVNLGIDSKLLRMSNINYIDDDRGATELDLYELVESKVFTLYSDKLTAILKAVGRRMSKQFKENYINHCLIPEGIIVHLEAERDVSAVEAEKIFMANLTATVTKPM